MLNLDKNKHYLLACSYGPDSMALFDMLQKKGYKFAVANVNYNLRPESTKESEDLQKYCEKHNISLFHKGFAGVFKGNIEKQCREIRYNFFKQIIDENGFDALLVAHHLDDHIETYLLQKRRHNIPDYFGIQTNTTILGMNVIRPLLNFDKKYLLNYCEENNIPYCVDSSNFENVYLRNKIRHEIIEKLTPSEKEKFVLKIAESNAELQGIKSNVSNLELTKKTLLKLTDLELCIFFSLKAKELKANHDVSLRKINEIRKVLQAKKANSELKITRNLMLENSYGELIVYKIENTNFLIKMNKPSKVDNKYFYCDFSNEFENRNVKLEDFPITIRNALLGDEVEIKDYFVKIRRLFIDWKMPLRLRRKWPVIVNKDNKVIYVPRYQKHFVKDTNINFYVK